MTPIEAAREAARKVLEHFPDIGPDTHWPEVADEVTDAFLATLAAQGLVIVPKEASEEMADTVRGMLATEFRCSVKLPLGPMLEAMGRLPACLTEEERALTHVPPKRWQAAMLYRAMIAASPHNSNPTQSDKAESN